jgi:tripartite-type tricarboxylate transporter receptor subunit TctC
MKKLFSTLLLALCVSSAWAKETITVVYAFSISDTMANYSRTLIEEANRSQDKYQFILEAKPGAGGSIASRHVAATPNTILATSGAFFVRPNFFPNESHRLEDFRELLVQTSAPMSASSIKYKSWKDIPSDAPINIGVSGLGVVSHLSAVQIMTKYPNAQIVPFKSTTDALLSLLSGNLDIAIGFMGEQEKWADQKTPDGKAVTILGITGPRSVNGRPTYVSGGLPAVFSKMNNPNHLVVPKSMPEAQFKELREILFKASKAKSVTQSYEVDFGSPQDIATDKLDAWYADQAEHWAKMSAAAKATMK